jgi:hypothetical protein
MSSRSYSRLTKILGLARRSRRDRLGNGTTAPQRQARLALELLEDRRVLSTFGSNIAGALAAGDRGGVGNVAGLTTSITGLPTASVPGGTPVTLTATSTESGQNGSGATPVFNSVWQASNAARETALASQALSFIGTNQVALPSGVIDGAAHLTIDVTFETTSGGVILGYQNQAAGSFPSNYVPALYVGTDGHLYGELWDGAVAPMRSGVAVNDGQAHQAVLTYSGGMETLTLDNAVAGTINASEQPLKMSFEQLGTGYTTYWPGGTGGFDPFVGTVERFALLTGTTMAGSLAFPGSRNDQVVFTTPDQGTYSVGLLTTDAAGNTASARADIEASAVAPTVAITGLPGGSTNAGTAVALSDTVSDPGRADMAAGFNVLWQAGVGSGQTVVAGEALAFNGNNPAPLPSGLVNGASNLDVNVSFATTSGRVILGYQNAVPSAGPTNYVPALYVGTDGHLYAELWDGAVAPIRSIAAVNDGAAHTAEVSYASGVETLKLDGSVAGTINASAQPLDMTFDQLGTGSTSLWPGGNGGVVPFVGTISQVVITTGGEPTSAFTFSDAGGTNVLFTPPQPGTDTIAVSTTDQHGNTGVQTASINAVAPPFGLLIDPYQLHTGPNQQTRPQTTFSTYALLEDSAGDGPWSVTVNYGDGSGDQTSTLTNPIWGVGGAVISLSHDYQATGTYTLTVSVTNAYGVTETATASVIIGYGARVPNNNPVLNPYY